MVHNMICLMIKPKQILAAVGLSVLVVLAYTAPALAAQSNSANYGVSEVNFGSGGEVRGCSTTFCARQSAGDLVVGNTKGTQYQAEAGGVTNRTPYLELVVASGVIDLGEISAIETKSGTKPFTVRTYLASGYVVNVTGTPLKNKTSGYELNAMSGTASALGTEQFGINLADNSLPDIGASPVQVPDGTFSFGKANTGYATANSYKFVSGDTVANSDTTNGNGQTDYTMSVIANAATTTPGGRYNTRLTLNVIPTF